MLLNWEHAILKLEYVNLAVSVPPSRVETLLHKTCTHKSTHQPCLSCSPGAVGSRANIFFYIISSRSVFHCAEVTAPGFAAQGAAQVAAPGPASPVAGASGKDSSCSGQ